MKAKHLSRTLLSAGLALASLAAPALAQDHGGWLDEEKDPLAPSAAPNPKTEPVPEEELTPEERRQRDRAINRNYADAQKTYDEILTKDPSGPLERRIQNNERIVAEFRGRIQRATNERRQAQVDLYNRTFFLKQQLEKKQITPDVYDKLIREQELKFEQSEANYKVNGVAWQKEVDEALKRLDDLRAQHRLLEAQKPRRQQPRRQRDGAEGPTGPRGSQLVGTLKQRLTRLGQFQRRHTMVGVHPRSLSSSPGRVASAD